MKKQELKLRREHLLKVIDSDSVIVLFSAKEHIRSGDVKYPFRQDSDFYYLTGFIEPDSVAVLISGKKGSEFVLFSSGYDGVKELWGEGRLSQKEVCLEFGADRSYSTCRIDEVLPSLLKGKSNIYLNGKIDEENGKKLKFWANEANQDLEYRFYDIGKFLHQIRLKKSKFELGFMRKAIEATAKGHIRAMQKCCPGMHEFELEAEMLYEFKRNNCQVAYETIVAGGRNGCILHYSKNSDVLVDGDLVVLDAGAEYGCYCADVTRTFPINGRFSSEQKAVYELVLRAQNEIIKHVRPGVSWDHLQFIAEWVIKDGLVRLGILSGDVEELCNKKRFKPFFMHKFGHWIGLDVHDVGGYLVGDKCRVLEPGMVFTVEPGVYLRDGEVDLDEKWRGIGIRIEDNVLVTDVGCEVLTDQIPKKITEIERLMDKKTN